jgi:hypothetical protein
MATAYTLTGAVAVLMLLQSSLGLLYRHHYRDVEWIAATWLGNDWITLVVALPLLAVGAVLARRGSPRGQLLWLGTLGYALYNYFYYLLGAALNVFFPLYLGAVIAAALALILALSSTAAVTVARRFNAGTPVRLIGGYFAFVGISLASIWLAVWGAYVFTGRPTPVETEAFKLVAALDTVLMVPLLVIGGGLLWRRQAWGYVVSAIGGVQGSLYLLVLSLNSLIAASSELPLWSALAVTMTAATALLLANTEPANPRTPRTRVGGVTCSRAPAPSGLASCSSRFSTGRYGTCCSSLDWENSSHVRSAASPWRARFCWLPGSHFDGSVRHRSTMHGRSV